MGSSGECESVDGNSYIKKAGPYMLGPKLGNSPARSVENCLARKDGTDEFYVLKILKNLYDDSCDASSGKILLHTEYVLLKLLEGEPGVVQQHGLFKDEAVDEDGERITRLCLVLDCYVPHDFSPDYSDVTNLQLYVVDMKRLSENEALNILVQTLKIIQRLHNRNIAHRDLKLGNIILNKGTGEVRIANFCLGIQFSENEALTDQRGSPAYISPDVICGQPYLGKPSDMWSMGVVFYTMLFGQFPFYDRCPRELFRQIKECEYTFPESASKISAGTMKLIKGLLVLDPKARLTCEQVLEQIIINASHVGVDPPLPSLQVVPAPEQKLESNDSIKKKKPTRISITKTTEDHRVLTHEELQKVFTIYSSKKKDPAVNIRHALKRL